MAKNLKSCDAGHTPPRLTPFRTVPIGRGQPVTGTAQVGERLTLLPDAGTVALNQSGRTIFVRRKVARNRFALGHHLDDVW